MAKQQIRIQPKEHKRLLNIIHQNSIEQRYRQRILIRYWRNLLGEDADRHDDQSDGEFEEGHDKEGVGEDCERCVEVVKGVKAIEG